MNWLLDLFLDRTLGAKRDSRWAKLSKECIEEALGLCHFGMHKPAIWNPLSTHHIKKFSEHPELELEKSNLVVLCWLHHFVHAHLKNYHRSNPDILAECDALNRKIMNKV